MRSDGALKNGIVTYDSLSTSLQAAGLAPADAWATATSYLVNKSVVQNSSLYRALVAHISGVFATDLAAGKWVLVTALLAGPAGPQGAPGSGGGDVSIATVRATTTGNVNLAAGLENGDTIDGIALATGNLVLVWQQSAPAENGIYAVPASGAGFRFQYVRCELWAVN
ncbi:hypothetical protein [Tardiphaga sp. 862_B3_N1_1]|uniref:hypothetical protein n=1 Tax=Tardiphaga sp. 862_B3_N1_1 TaxID=3240763 RepID=UPI003F88E1BB